MSAVSQGALSEVDARRLTERIRIAAVNYSEAKEKLLRLVSEAKEGSAHEALGYKSWTAYLSDVMSEEPLRLAKDERREVVQLLTEEGMSTRAIAPIVGASKSQVSIDRAGVQNWTSDPAEPTGLDGKTYSRPAPSAPSPEPASKPAPRVDMASNFEQAITGMNLTLSVGDPQTDLTEAQRQLAIRELERIINRIKGEEP